MARILVIDDNRGFREMLADMLERNGYTVLEAPDGEAGIRLYRQSPCDLIITDLIMPGKEGFETINDLKQEFPDVKIIAMTGVRWVDTEDYLKLAGRLGAQRTLAKPFNQKEVLETIRDLLDQTEN